MNPVYRISRRCVVTLMYLLIICWVFLKIYHIRKNEAEAPENGSLLHFSPAGLQKTTVQNVRNLAENFVIFSEKLLDISINRWYIIQARVGKLRVHCDDAGDCGESR